MLTSWNGLFFTLKDGYCQFIGGDSIEGDFPNASIASYQELFNGLESGDTGITNWYNAKTSREAVNVLQQHLVKARNAYIFAGQRYQSR